MSARLNVKVTSEAIIVPSIALSISVDMYVVFIVNSLFYFFLDILIFNLLKFYLLCKLTDLFISKFLFT